MVQLQHEPGVPHDHATTSSTLSAVLHPIPLSLIAVSVLAALRLGAWGPPSRWSSRVSSSAAHSGLDSGPAEAVEGASSSGTPAQRAADKKKRSKERRKRGKDVAKDVESKSSRGLPQRPLSASNDSHAAQPEEPYASSSNAHLATPRATYSRSSRAQNSQGGVMSSGPADNMSYDGMSDDDYVAEPQSTLVSHRRRNQDNNNELVPIPQNPLPPSSVTFDVLAAFTDGQRRVSEEFRAPAKRRSESQDITLVSTDFSPHHRRPSSPSPSTTTSMFSGPLSSAPSSNLSPLTPPPNLPPSQSFPSASLIKGYGGPDRLDIHVQMGEPSIWEEEETVGDFDGYEGELQPMTHVSGRKSPRALTTSVSMPTWDRSLDWDPRQSRKGGRSTSLRDSMPQRSPESARHTESSPQTQQPNVDVLFPSLYDPPPANDALEVSEDMSVGALVEALEALRASEEKWRQECGRLGQECERIKWAWSEDVRKLHIKEHESQQLQHQLLRAMSVQPNGQQPLPSPAAYFPVNDNGRPPNGKPSHPILSPLPLATPSNLQFPFAGVPTVMGGFPFTPAMAGTTPMGHPGAHSRPPSVNSGRRPNGSRSSRNHSSSRASSPYKNTHPPPMQFGQMQIPLNYQNHQYNGRSVSRSSQSSSHRPTSLNIPAHFSSSSAMSGSSAGGSSPKHHIGTSTLDEGELEFGESVDSVDDGMEEHHGGDIEDDGDEEDADDGDDDDDDIPDQLASAILKIHSPRSRSSSRTFSSASSSGTPASLSLSHLPPLPPAKWGSQASSSGSSSPPPQTRMADDLDGQAISSISLETRIKEDEVQTEDDTTPTHGEVEDMTPAAFGIDGSVSV